MGEFDVGYLLDQSRNDRLTEDVRDLLESAAGEIVRLRRLVDAHSGRVHRLETSRRRARKRWEHAQSVLKDLRGAINAADLHLPWEDEAVEDAGRSGRRG